MELQEVQGSDLFQWFYLQKIEGRNSFWKLLELIAGSNDYENVTNAQVDEIPDGEAAAVGGDRKPSSDEAKK